MTLARCIQSVLFILNFSPMALVLTAPPDILPGLQSQEVIICQTIFLTLERVFYRQFTLHGLLRILQERRIH